IKTLAQLGEGGPRKWWVRVLYVLKTRKIVNLEQPLIRPFGHLYLDGEKTNSACSENFHILKICLG
ncbi:MAG: hypothetical protein VW995_13390, partial [Deltaproteobacteria bacterium]